MSSDRLSQPDAAAEFRVGLTASLAAFFLWGLLPIYYKLLGAADAWIIVAHRIIWSLVFVAGFLAVVQRLGEVKTILHTPAQLTRLCLSGAIILINWTLFIWAIEQSRVLEVSFGYFLTPIMTIMIGMVVLGERLSARQKMAVAIAAAAVLSEGVSLGGLPWISVTLAVSFAGYSYLRKTVPVNAMPGLMVETLISAPLALGFLGILAIQGVVVMPISSDPGLSLLLIGSGVLTALPLVFFATGARRLPLTTLGILQYIVPSFHFLIAWLVFGEALSPWRAATFGLIWLSLVLYTGDMLAAARRKKSLENPLLRRQSQPIR